MTPATTLDTVSVTERSTSSLRDLRQPVAIDQASTCTVTVTDSDAGLKSDPSGTVSFASGGGGAFSGLGSCALVQ